MKIESYFYSYDGKHTFSFQTQDVKEFLNSIEFDDFIIDDLFFEVGGPGRIRWFDYIDINITNYKNFLTLINSFNDIFLSRFELISGVNSLCVHDESEIHLTISKIDVLVPKLMSFEIFEILKENQNANIVINEDNTFLKFDSFDKYIDFIRSK